MDMRLRLLALYRYRRQHRPPKWYRYVHVPRALPPYLNKQQSDAFTREYETERVRRKGRERERAQFARVNSQIIAARSLLLFITYYDNSIVLTLRRFTTSGSRPRIAAVLLCKTSRCSLTRDGRCINIAERSFKCFPRSP